MVLLASYETLGIGVDLHFIILGFEIDFDCGRIATNLGR